MPHKTSDTPVAGPGTGPRQSVGSPQQELSGGADVPRNDIGAEETVSRAEFNKVVGQRQAAKEKARQLTAEVEQLLARLEAMPDEQELRAYQDWQKRQEAAGIPPDQQGQDMHAIAARVRRPLEEKVEALRSSRDALERRLRDLVRDQELRAAAARANAINPDQVVALLRDRVRLTETDEGQFVPELVDVNGGPVFDGPHRVTETRRFVELFLSLPENANLVRSMVVPGSGARQAGGTATNTDMMPRTKAEFLSLPADQRLALANRMTAQQRDALLGRGSAEGGGYL